MRKVIKNYLNLAVVLLVIHLGFSNKNKTNQIQVLSDANQAVVSELDSIKSVLYSIDKEKIPDLYRYINRGLSQDVLVAKELCIPNGYEDLIDSKNK